MNFENSLEFARQLDTNDTLSHFRDKFLIPKYNGTAVSYFCGNSLGLQPKAARDFVEEELSVWENLGVEGHFKPKDPWFSYHKLCNPILAKIVGAKEKEVVAMNNLTTNLHLMMVSFYQPNSQRYKIIMESGAFPSDQYAIESQVRFHGYEPGDAIIEIAARSGEHALRTSDIIDTIERHQNEVALVILSGVQYYTGQFFDLKQITKAAHAAGAYAGFDLAHAIGNVPLQLHDWNLDFAVWCSYKYLNSSPGGVAGAFVHERHENNRQLPRFAGWWGHDEQQRFLMKKGFHPMIGADGWQLSNASIIPLALHRSSLLIFEEAGLEKLRKKSLLLTGYLVFLLEHLMANNPGIEIITPKEHEQRGCQLSILIHHRGKALFDHLMAAAFVVDWREPNVIRVAPTPLYNTFDDVFRFATTLSQFLK